MIRKKLLKVFWPDKRRIEVRVVVSGDKVRINTKNEFDVLKSAPENDFGARLLNGQFFINCSLDEYPSIIQKFTKYLEDVIFELMLIQEKNDADTNSSTSSKTKSGGNRKRNSPSNHGKNKGKKLRTIFPGVFGGPGGDKQTESDRGWDDDNSVAQEDDTSVRKDN